MEEAMFQKELSKYKVVRQPDYYKNRVKNVTRFNKSSTVINSMNKDANVSNGAQVINPNESNFWELFSAVNSNVLTTAESMKFIETLKLVSCIQYFITLQYFITFDVITLYLCRNMMLLIVKLVYMTLRQLPHPY